MPIASILLCLVLMELGLRAHHLAFKQDTAYFLTHDKELGWKGTASPQGLKTKIKFGAREARQYKTNLNGFIEFEENPDPKKKTLFLVGDSYTQAIEVNHGEAYYESFKEKFNLFVFAASGYGTYQEYLVLKKYLPLIKPDLVLLQFCSNDFINNSFELSRIDKQNMAPFKRKFLNKKKILTSESFSQGLFKHSRAVMFLYTNYILLKASEPSLDVLIDSGRFNLGELKLELSHTMDLLSLVKNLVHEHKSDLLIFNISSEGPLKQAYSGIINELKITSLDSTIQDLHENTLIYATDGSHLNKKGHQILGSKLLESL